MQCSTVDGGGGGGGGGDGLFYYLVSALCLFVMIGL